MENKIDQFFKDKIEGHSLPPSEEAWAKVEANLSKKNNVAIWRIAAAVLITGALISVIIWSQRGVEKNQDVVVAKKSLKENMIKEQPAPQISQTEKKANSNSSPRSLTSIKSVQKETGVSSVKTKTMVVEVEKNKSSFAKALESKQEEKLNQEATQPTIIASTKQKPIKLEFTLEDFSSEQREATVNEAKSTGLKKVWEVAREVKNGEGPVREIKNELFALNFKKNKNQ